MWVEGEGGGRRERGGVRIRGSIVPDVPWRICRNRVPVSVDRVRV